ncbi:helix-turn-helix domain-containing protein [Amycolatopsis anabasis]|uniref:helix-turn-helix domain-containing protein n=1 Tax=Amycolatopsis anabasis TaxID=1840409 RepID=UPI00131A977C|nr:helix-turn-helix domain-containing protein [Amycolatopsis anabasis]
MTTVFSSSDLDEFHEFARSGYAACRIQAHPSGCRALIVQNPLGPIRMDRIHLGFVMDYAFDPLGTLSLISVKSGAIPHNVTERVDTSCGPGEVIALAQPDRPYSGRVSHARYTYTSLEPSLLSQVADTAPHRTPRPVRLSGYRPVSPAAGRHLLRTIAYLHDHVLTAPTFRDSPLIVSTAPQLLAATVLSTFPNTALPDPTIEDRHDSHPCTLRRAMAFIDDHAHEDICAADIATSCHVTIRAVQYAFRRHLGTTLMGYLRQVRLQRAHQELLAADPTTGVTVTEIAARWGFFHPGRFAHHYRTVYGCPPYRTLQRDT